ncbi:PLP-dependent aminotransferase family protein [Burkholderia sp. L27(2015)]|uniref:aminotransferase-like domain-containing protein n=1 Tax=Burkholderia sp. L27(2015) TaxID=1641858 RepID=UPI00131D4685|nr:PLP-dependent aminotransferase family protein [Burkholderia sp. L27(2015)]
MKRLALFELDRERPQSLVDQLVGAVTGALAAHLLRAGMRMPSVRQLAQEQGVSTFTVVEAYDRLVAQGVLVARRGAGFFVAGKGPSEASMPQREPGALDIGNTWLLSEVFADNSDSVKAGCGWLPATWVDEAGVHGALRQLAKDVLPEFVNYGQPRGYLPLRQWIARRLEDMAIDVRPEQVILTHGATQALDVIARTLLRPGDTVLVEEPGYCNLLEILARTGARVIGVRRTPQGLDLAQLDILASQYSPRALFLNTALQNPMGTSLTPACVHRVLQLAERHDFHIVEDDIYRDLAPQGTALFAALDGLNRVIYVNSFSKTISPSTRVGYIACTAALCGDLTRTKMVAGLTTSEINERLVHTILTEGRHRKHVERLGDRLARARGQVSTRLADSGMTLLAEPAGGMFVCASLPEGAPHAREVAQQALAAGVILAPGEFFMASGVPTHWLRFNVAFSDDPRLYRFLDALADRYA